MAKYKPKTSEPIEAEQWDGASWDRYQGHPLVMCDRARGVLAIQTSNGIVDVLVGDWVVWDVVGKPHPISDEVFQETYEPADE